jgi:predicted permease
MSALAAIPAILAAKVVDGEALLDATVASLIAGVTVTFAASTAIYGLATFAERRREGREAAAIGAAAIGALGVLVFAGAIGVGLFVMISR